MHIEKRREDRSIFTRQPKGKLQILAGERCIHVSAVKDMSLTGLRLETSLQVNVGENVLIRYIAEGVDLKLNGMVVWGALTPDEIKEAGNASRYTVGIKLASPSLLQAFW